MTSDIFTLNNENINKKIQQQWQKLNQNSENADETLIIRRSNVEEISAEIAAENSENSWFVSKSFISMRLDFSKDISSFFSLILTLIDIMIEFISQLYSQ